MPSQRLFAIITVLIYAAGSGGAQAEFTLSQLQDIERLIARKDCGALWTYLTVNPELMEGNDPLAQELRVFASGIDSGLIDCLSDTSVSRDLGQTTASSQVIAAY